jgi:integrase
MTTVRTSVETLLDHYAVALKNGRNKPGTRNYYRSQFKHLLRLVDPDKELSTVTATDLLACPAKKAFGECMRRLFRFHGVPIPRGYTVPRGGQRRRTLPIREFRRLRYATRGPARWLLWVMYHTGARPRELRELTWQQVSTDDRVLMLTDFKCRDSRGDGLRVRYIPLPRVVARVLAGWKRDRKPGYTDLVFTNARGNPWRHQALGLAVRRARRRAGLEQREGEEATAYSLRHTYATDVARAGMKDTLLADVLGHADLQTTRRYLHRTGADLVRECDKVIGKRGRSR